MDVQQGITVLTMRVEGKVLLKDFVRFCGSLVNNSTLTTLDLRYNQIGVEECKAITDLLERTSRQPRPPPITLMTVDPEEVRENVAAITVISQLPSLPLTHPSFADLRERYTADGFGALPLDMARERALVAAVDSRECIQRGAATVECVVADWQAAIVAQQSVLTSMGEDEQAMGDRDRAVSKFIDSSLVLVEVEESLSVLSFAVPAGDTDDGSGSTLSVAEVDAVVRDVVEWIEWMEAVSGARDAFVAAHNELGIAIGSGVTPAMKEAEQVCLKRALSVEEVAAEVTVIPPSPLQAMPANQCVRVIIALRSQRSSFLRDIVTLQQHRRELLSHGDTCPSTDPLKTMRKRLKQTTRKVDVLEMEYRHAVEDDEDTAESAAMLDQARADQRTAARAVDAEWLRLSLASTRCCVCSQPGSLRRPITCTHHQQTLSCHPCPVPRLTVTTTND